MRSPTSRFVRACVVSAGLFVLASSAACAAAGDDEERIGTDDSYVVEDTRAGKKDAGADAKTTDAGVDPRYATIAGLRDQALKDALYEVVKGHRSLGYDRARDVLLGGGGHPGIGLVQNKLECVYTGRLALPDGSRAPNDLNTEHSWPQSMGANREPARSDLHHLYPSDERANSSRGNNPFGEVTCLHGGGAVCNYSVAGSALGRTQKSVLAFEVREEKRGDIARAHFYFSVRYDKSIPADEEATLRAWNAEDPVDAYERSRNDEIETFQKNRNPFIDYPAFADAISDF